MVTCLLQAPALWAFQVVAGAVGLDAAVDACHDRMVPGVASAALRAAGYDAADLPAIEDIMGALWAVRLRQRRRTVRGETLQDAAEALGGTLDDAHVALRAWECYVPMSMKSRVTP